MKPERIKITKSHVTDLQLQDGEIYDVVGWEGNDPYIEIGGNRRWMLYTTEWEPYSEMEELDVDSFIIQNGDDVWVWDNGDKIKHKAIYIDKHPINGTYIVTYEDDLGEVEPWDNIEFREDEEVKVTIEEIAEKFGTTAENLTIVGAETKKPKIAIF